MPADPSKRSHRKPAPAPAAESAPRFVPVIVLGGGYAGLHCALGLSNRLATPADVLLVDSRPNHELVVQLHEAAVGRVPQRALAHPLAELAPEISHLQAEVTGVDAAAMTVATSAGELGCKYLVVALGSETAWPEIPGLREAALPLRWLADAEALRARLAERPGRVLVVGGGATGVQLAGECAADGMPVTLAESAPGLLPRFPGGLGAAARDSLVARGVDVRLAATLTAVESGVARFAGGAEVPFATLVWAGGIAMPHCLVASGVSDGGPVRVDGNLRLRGAKNVYVIGDCAAVPSKRGGVYPPSAQVATQMGDYVADHLVRRFKGRPTFAFKPSYRGEAISVGPRAAVARVGPAVLHGFSGYAIKRFTEEKHVEAIGGVKLLRAWSQV